MDDRIVNLAYDILTILLPMLAVLLAEWLRRKLGVERLQRVQRELETKKELAVLAVQFAEQAYRHYRGEEKYQAAAQWLSTQAIDRGMHLTSDEIQGLIESTVRKFKDSFGEGWAT